MCGPGDLNGDGFGDVLIGTAPGQAVLLFGRSDLAQETRLEEELFALRASRLALEGREAMLLGFAPVGDLTGDGIDDVALALVRNTSQPTGELLFLAGRSAWPEEFDLDAAGLVRSRLRGPPNTRRFLTWTPLPLGDANGDGFGDVLIQRSSTPRRAYVVYGSPELPAEADFDSYLEAGGGVGIELDPPYQTIRLEAQTAGDVNGDGWSDILLLGHQNRLQPAPLTLVVPGATDLPSILRIAADGAGDDGVLRIREGEWRATGTARTAGDFNNDGYDDFLLGRGEIPEAGLPEDPRVFLVLGGPDRFERPATVDLTDLRGAGMRIDGPPHGFLEPTPASAGDLNGDGLKDFALFESELFFDEDVPDEQTVYVLYGIPGPAAGRPFLRGDANADGRIDLADAAFALAYLFAGGATPVCEDALDANDDGGLNLTDFVYLVVYLFNGGGEPPPPFATAGKDPSEDGLTCAQP